MPIASWILFPATGSFDRMLEDVASIEGCEIMTDTVKQIAILVTDTPDAEADRNLHARLESLTSVAQASLVFAHAQEQE